MSDFEYDVESGAQLAQEVSIALADGRKASGLTAGGETGAEAARKLRGRLDELDKTVKRLEAALADMEPGGRAPVPARALAQRREAVKKLAIEARRLREREQSSAFGAASDRASLLSSGAGKSYGRETELTREITTQEMVQRSNMEIKNQDAVLEKMSRSLDTLKTMGGAIKDETALQMRLLDDTGDKIDDGNTALKRETARVEHVIKSSGTCWLYTLICLLLVVLVVMIILYFK